SGQAWLRSERAASAQDRGRGFSTFRSRPGDGPGSLRDSRAYGGIVSRPQAEVDDVLRAALQGAGGARPLLRGAAGVRARTRHARGRCEGPARVPAKGLSPSSGFKFSESGARARFPPEPTARRDPEEAAGAPAWPAQISAPAPSPARRWRPNASEPTPARFP